MDLMSQKFPHSFVFQIYQTKQRGTVLHIFLLPYLIYLQFHLVRTFQYLRSTETTWNNANTMAPQQTLQSILSYNFQQRLMQRTMYLQRDFSTSVPCLPPPQTTFYSTPSKWTRKGIEELSSETTSHKFKIHEFFVSGKHELKKHNFFLFFFLR